jgi:hypothetical protein
MYTHYHEFDKSDKVVKFRIVFWDVLTCNIIVIPDDGGSTHLLNVGRQLLYIPEYNSEFHTRRRENLKSHIDKVVSESKEWVPGAYRQDPVSCFNQL